MLKPREIDDYLLPTERRVIRVRQHWAVLWKELTLTALFVLALLWWNERIVITDKRLMWDRGIITQNLGMMPLTKVTDLTFQRSLGGRMLGYGTVIVESAGQNQAFERITYIPQPDEVYEALSELVFGDKGRTRAIGLLGRPWWRR